MLPIFGVGVSSQHGERGTETRIVDGALWSHGGPCGETEVRAQAAHQGEGEGGAAFSPWLP